MDAPCVMGSSHSQKSLNSECHSQVQTCFGVVEVHAADLANAVEPVAKRVGVDPQPLGGLLLLAGFEVGAQGGDQASVAGAVVLRQRSEQAAGVVDQALVGDRREQPGESG